METMLVLYQTDLKGFHHVMTDKSCITTQKREKRESLNQNWPTRLPSMSGQAASSLQLPALTEPPYRILKWEIALWTSQKQWTRLMPLFSDLVDSATAGDTLEDNQPLSARCTSCSARTSWNNFRIFCSPGPALEWQSCRCQSPRPAHRRSPPCSSRSHSWLLLPAGGSKPENIKNV